MKNKLIIGLAIIGSFGFMQAGLDLSPDAVLNDLKGLAGQLKIDVPLDKIEDGIKGIAVKVGIDPSAIVNSIKGIANNLAPILQEISKLDVNLGKDVAGIAQSMFNQAQQVAAYAAEHLKEAALQTEKIAQLGLTGKEKEAAEAAVSGLKSQAGDLLAEAKNNVLYGIGILKLGFKDFVVYAGGQVFHTIEDAVNAITKSVPCGDLLRLSAQLPVALVTNEVLRAVLTVAQSELDNLNKVVHIGGQLAADANVVLKPVAGAIYHMTGSFIGQLQKTGIDIKKIYIDADFSSVKNSKVEADVEIAGKTFKAVLDLKSPANSLKSILAAASKEFGGLSGIMGSIKGAIS